MAVRQTSEFIYTQEFSRVVAAAFKTNPAAALMVTPMARLIKEESFVPTPATLLTEVEAVEADFTDYVEKAVTLVEPANVGPEVEGCIATVAWNMTTDPVVETNTIWGYFIEADGVLVGCEMFSEGQQVSMAEVGDFLTLNLSTPVRNYQGVN